MEKFLNYHGTEDIVVTVGRRRSHIILNFNSLGVSSEQKAELEAIFNDLCATLNKFVDDNTENFEKIFPETEDED